MKYETTLFNENILPTLEIEKEIIDFLYEALEGYGDPKQDIEMCIAYALKKSHSFGGLIATVRDTEIIEQPIISCIIYNYTGMKKYIPESILVYVATDKKYRGQGIGRALIEKTLNHITGSVALHCEHDNPARLLYEKIGFESKYLEMRLKK